MKYGWFSLYEWEYEFYFRKINKKDYNTTQII